MGRGADSDIETLLAPAERGGRRPSLQQRGRESALAELQGAGSDQLTQTRVSELVEAVSEGNREQRLQAASALISWGGDLTKLRDSGRELLARSGLAITPAATSEERELLIQPVADNLRLGSHALRASVEQVSDRIKQMTQRREIGPVAARCVAEETTVPPRELLDLQLPQHLALAGALTRRAIRGMESEARSLSDTINQLSATEWGLISQPRAAEFIDRELDRAERFPFKLLEGLEWGEFEKSSRQWARARVAELNASALLVSPRWESGEILATWITAELGFGALDEWDSLDPSERTRRTQAPAIEAAFQRFLLNRPRFAANPEAERRRALVSELTGVGGASAS